VRLIPTIVLRENSAPPKFMGLPHIDEHRPLLGMVRSSQESIGFVGNCQGGKLTPLEYSCCTLARNVLLFSAGEPQGLVGWRRDTPLICGNVRSFLFCPVGAEKVGLAWLKEQ
jgi:hypothetical protein